MQKNLFLLLILFCYNSYVPIDLNGEENKMITINDLNKLKVIGKLGKSLGELITIEGQVIAEDRKTSSKLHWGKLMVKIDKINNENIKPVILEMRYRPSMEKDKWPIGKIHCLGYESGEFSGNPKEVYYLTGSPFCFRTHFIALQDIKDAGEPQAPNEKK